MKNYIKIITSFVLLAAVLMNIFAIATFSAGVGEIALAMESVSGKAGETVSVDITIEKNTGVSFLKFSVAYSEHLTLTGVTLNESLAGKDGITAPTPYKNPQVISMMSALSEVKATGHIATFTFKIADDAPAGEYPLSIVFDQDFTIDGNLDNVTGSAVCGSVTVAEAEAALLGDVNLDGEIDAKDLTLLARHVAKIEYITDQQALVNADINKDGGISSEDLTKLARHVAKIEYIVQ